METKKRMTTGKILLFLPVLIILLLAFTFSYLGGGKSAAGLNQQKVKAGMNTNLPDANINKDEPKDKLGFYDLADNDSSGHNKSGSIQDVGGRLGFTAESTQPQTKEINAKLEALNKEINKPVETGYKSSSFQQGVQGSSIKNDVDRLENLMKTMQNNKTEDPEMTQLNGLMQNILDIQHPERVQQKYKNQPVFTDSIFKAIPATIADNKKAVQGATVRVILQDTMSINGMVIPKGHALFGACQIVNQRLLLDIKLIRLGTSIIPVNLSVYSLDGMIGIDAPEAMFGDALNGGADNAIRGIGFGFDQTLVTQVAGAGIEAAKGLMNKKLRNVKVKLHAGKAILLRNNDLKVR
ncbi:hypothetical protein AQ505_12900 [Pedobacter sp. PACM 27299]|uniref:conjugative transposon protein TraM n=1 Tax=Pedobacter sp. PACM 27299 TaxID=1727164 RepID=UPI0007057339|nr:conjugative transposon protein TraM [Pedobacter sp. PACM 27299]ALL06317.1 hypothetical protein AQ505_12900 [Pedobacter sp. PACM 27299]